VKVVFDTSVIVAALLPKHTSHAACFVHLQAARSRQIHGHLSTHSLAELYSVLTRMPGQPRIMPQEAKILINGCMGYLQAILLETADYEIAIARMVELNLPGGGIFDALIAQAALKISADRILTLNPSHFARLSVAIAQLTEVPES
jgi:predicted nucleic acid-binding protein